MGVCINIFGVPILEDAECRESRKDSKVDIIEAKTPRVIARQEANVIQTIARNYGTGTTPAEGIFGSVASTATAVTPGILAAATGGLSTIPDALGGLLGSLGLGGTDAAGNEEIDLIPIALAGAAAVIVLAVVMSSGDERRR